LVVRLLIQDEISFSKWTTSKLKYFKDNNIIITNFQIHILGLNENSK